MGCGVEGLFLRNRVRAEHADRTGPGTVRSVIAARHGRCTETASGSSNSTCEEGRAVAKQRAAGHRACRSNSSKQQQVNSAGRGIFGERGIGPVVGYLASSERNRDQDRHADSDNAAVDLGGDEGSDLRPGRPEHYRGAALYARA